MAVISRNLDLSSNFIIEESFVWEDAIGYVENTPIIGESVHPSVEEGPREIPKPVSASILIKE